MSCYTKENTNFSQPEKERKSTINKFALEDDEVENIFDILEQEHPDL